MGVGHERGYEGLVAKDEASASEAGRTTGWLKVEQKCWTDEDDCWRRRISMAPPPHDRRLALAPISRTRTACSTLPAVTLLAELDAFYTDHRRCGELEVGVAGPVAWIACDCGASMARRVDDDDHVARDDK